VENGLFTAPDGWNVAESARGQRLVFGRICVLALVVSGFSRTLIGPAVHDPCDSGSQMGFGGIPEFGDEWMPLERLLNDAPLNAFAAAMNQPHFTKSRLVRRCDVLLDDRGDVAWRERVQVQVVFDRDAVGHRATATLPVDRTR
jgi:hypothetical protein